MIFSSGLNWCKLVWTKIFWCARSLFWCAWNLTLKFERSEVFLNKVLKLTQDVIKLRIKSKKKSLVFFWKIFSRHYEKIVHSSAPGTWLSTFLQICRNVYLCAKKLAFKSVWKDSAFLAFRIYLYLVIHLKYISFKYLRTL